MQLTRKSPRTLLTQSLFTGGLLCIGFGRAALATSFTFQTVLDDQTPINGGVFQTADQVVAGNNGSVAVIAEFDTGKAITLNQSNGNEHTQIFASTDSIGVNTLNGYDGSTTSFAHFSELSLSQTGGTRLSFLADDTATQSNLGVYQASLAPGDVPLKAIEHDDGQAGSYTLQTDSVGMDLSQIHQQTNSSGKVAYQRRLGDQQSLTLANGTYELTDDGDLKDFNNVGVPSGTTDIGKEPIKRVFATENGSIVFRATDTANGGNSVNIYRSTDLSHPVVTGIINETGTLLGASDDRVLYSDVDLQTNVKSLYLTAVTGSNQPITTLISYTQKAGAPINTVITQGNRVAFFSPEDTPGHTSASLGYYHNSLSIIATDQQTFTDGQQYTIEHVGTDPASTPMVNDMGTVVYDAYLTDGDGHEVLALVAWKESTGQSQVVLKADLTGTGHGDTYSPDGVHQYAIGLFSINTLDGGDVLKDALSDDDYLAVAITYEVPDVNDPNTLIDHQAVISINLDAVPEPTTMGMVVMGLAFTSLKRRKRSIR